MVLWFVHRLVVLLKACRALAWQLRKHSAVQEAMMAPICQKGFVPHAAVLGTVAAHAKTSSMRIFIWRMDSSSAPPGWEPMLLNL